MNVFSCPNCRCGVTCTICSDTNNSGTCGLARITGTATGSTAYYTISTSNGIALSAVTSSTVPEVWAETDFILNTGGDQARLFIKSSSTGNNCWYTETMAGTGGAHFRLVERTAGVDTQRAIKSSITVPTSANLTMHICYGEGNVVGTLTGTTQAYQVSSTAATTVSSRPYAGVGTGSISSAVKFSNFEHTYGYNATDKPTCQSCVLPATGCDTVCAAAPSSMPTFDVVLDLSGGTHSRGTCGVTWATSEGGTECEECNTFDGEWTLPPFPGVALCNSAFVNGCPMWHIDTGTTPFWCSGVTGFKTDPSNVACPGEGSAVVVYCMEATFTYRMDTAKWHWFASVSLIGTNSESASYSQDPADPSIINNCTAGPWTLLRTAHSKYPYGNGPCDGELPASITLRLA